MINQYQQALSAKKDFIRVDFLPKSDLNYPHLVDGTRSGLETQKNTGVQYRLPNGDFLIARNVAKPPIVVTMEFATGKPKGYPLPVFRGFHPLANSALRLETDGGIYNTNTGGFNHA